MSLISTVQAGHQYRKDIDGLRAISVLLVVLYHLQCQFVKAGFIGVDIFFIISGYLITSQILNELRITDKFSFTLFYIRRIKRIVPALLIVLMCTSIAVFFLFFQSDIKTFFHSAIATLVFASNIYYWRYFHADLYFSGAGARLPLLHTWSLGIEEQFYIVWPIFLYFLFRESREAIIKKITFIIAVLSFSLYIAFRIHSNFVYFSPVTRTFELLIGALLSMMNGKNKITFSKKISDVLSITAIFFIIVPACFFDATFFPGVSILIPCSGVAILLLLGQEKNCIGNRILSNTVFVFFGLISYSLYLWHWPIIAFMNYFGYVHNFIADSVVFLTSVILATLTWQYIEKPCRYNIKSRRLKTIIPVFLLCCLPEMALSFAMIKDPSSGYNSVPKNILPEFNYYGLLKKEYGCFNESTNLYYPSEKLCSIGDLKQDRIDVLITGDSHAMANVGMLNEFLKDANLKGYVFSQFQIGYRQCHRLYDQMLKIYIIKNHVHYVVFARWWSIYTDKQVSRKFQYKNYEKIILNMQEWARFCKKHNISPVIIYDFPSLSDISKTCGFSKISQAHCYNKLSRVLKINKVIKEKLASLRKYYPNIIYIDPKKIICDKNNCYSSLLNHPLYADGHSNSHLSYFGSMLIGKQYLKKYGNPFLNHK